MLVYSTIIKNHSAYYVVTAAYLLTILRKRMIIISAKAI